MSFGSFTSTQSESAIRAQMRYEDSAKRLPSMSDDDWEQIMHKRGVVPKEVDSLPVSPLLMHRHTKELYPWAPEFAEMHDPADHRGITFLFINCDKEGNTDPAAWQGKPVYIGIDGPDDMTYEELAAPEPEAAPSALIQPPNILLEAEAFGLIDYYKDGMAESDISADYVE